jgi:hypothetical protein
VASVFALIGGLVLGPAAAATAADPSPTAGTDALDIGEPVAGKSVCSLGGSLNTVSGLVATESGYAAVNDGSGGTRSNISLVFLDDKCKTTSTFTNSAQPRDPEDLALGKDGKTVWVADFGDDNKDRPTIALWKVPANHSSAASRYRLSYPDGKHNAEAILLDADDTPIVLTKDGGTAKLYKPTAKLVANNETGLPLKKVGEFKPAKTDTENQMSVLGNQVTGAARSPDGTKVVIRTYADAYEFDVADGDVVKAVTTGKPRITRLPNEPDGSAITYSADGSQFYTVSKVAADSDSKPKILSYAPHVTKAAEPTKAPAAGGGGTSPGSGLSWFDKLSPSDLTRIAAAVGAVGLALAIAGIVGIRRARRRRREEQDDDYDDYDEGYDDAPPRRGGGQAMPPAPRDPRYADGYDEFDPYAAPAGVPAGQRGGTYGGQAGYDAQGYGADGQPYAAQAGYDQAGYAAQQGYDQAGYGAQQGYDQAGYGAQQGYDQAGYAQAGYDQAGYAQAGYDQAGYAQAGYGQAPGYEAQGYAGQGYDQAGYGAAPGYDEAGQYGAAQPPYGADQYGQQYGGQPGYDAGQYAGQPGADPYGQQYGGQPGPDPYGEGYDPQYDPRRR